MLLPPGSSYVFFPGTQGNKSSKSYIPLLFSGKLMGDCCLDLFFLFMDVFPLLLFEVAVI